MRPFVMLNVRDGEFRTLDRSRDGVHCKFQVIVLAGAVIEFASNTTVSCGKGTVAPEAPPEDADQEAVVFALPPLASTQYLVTGVVNVIPEFPPMSPISVPDHVPAPAPVISEKQILLIDTAAAVIVRAVPTAEDRMYP